MLPFVIKDSIKQPVITMDLAPECTESSITLGLMPQQTEVRRPNDDWTGVTSTAERRKLQNRLNQRAYRK